MADIRYLPAPVTAVWEWQMRATCRGVDSEVFFNAEGERGSAKEIRDERAKRICAQCPVIDECRRHALAAREPYGVWGGLTVAQRAAILAAPGLPGGAVG